MAVVYVGSSSAGTGDGSSRSNKMAWTSLDTAIQTAAGGSAPYEVRFISEDSYLKSSSGQVATITHGGTLANPVRIRGWNVSDQLAYVILASNRSDPYVPPVPTGDDVWSPSSSNGTTGEILFNLDSGASHLVWEYITVQNVFELFRIRASLSMVQGQDIKLISCRRLFEVVAGTGGLNGVSKTQRCVWQRIDARGFSKQLIALNSSSYITIDSVYADSELQGYDGITAGPVTHGSTSGTACTDIIMSRCTIKNCVNYDVTATPYRISIAASGGTPSGGTFTLSYNGQTTSPLAYNATNATIKSALAAIGGLIPADVFVSGGGGNALPSGTLSLSLGFNTLESGPSSPITIDTSGLTGGSFAIATVQSWAALEAGYTQGDGISTEEYDTAILIENCYFETMGDGGVDLKSSSTIVRRCTALDCKRSFRTHPSEGPTDDTGVIIDHCVSRDPLQHPYPSGHPLYGTDAPTGNQAHFSTNGNLHVNEPHAIDTDATQGANSIVFECVDDSGAISVYGGVVERKTGSSQSYLPAGSYFKWVGSPTETVT